MDMKIQPSGKPATRQTGFSLIELMITVAVVAILASIATPMYQDQVRKTRRADGFACLMEATQRQESYFYTNNTYTTLPADISLNATCGVDGYYTLSFAAGISGDIATSYLATATRASLQVADTKCGDLTISSEGVKGNANATLPATSCW